MDRHRYSDFRASSQGTRLATIGHFVPQWNEVLPQYQLHVASRDQTLCTAQFSVRHVGALREMTTNFA
jgi:hypothetical protein